MSTQTAGAVPSVAAATRFTRSLVPGRTDGLGERFSTFDTDGSPVDLLYIREDLTSAPGVEDALRERVALLAGFLHPAFATIRELTHDNGRVALVTVPVSGQRLSELSGGNVPVAVRAAFVARLVRDVTAALAALERTAPDVTHAVLTADRILVARDGRLCITEHVFAPALEQLALWPEELWLQFGLLAPADEQGHALFDRRTTVMQLGAIALSVLIGRPVTLQDFEHRLPPLIDEAAATAASGSAALAAPLRAWIERALHVTADGYVSASEASVRFATLLNAAGPEAAADMTALTFPLSSRPKPRASTEQSASPAAPARAGAGVAILTALRDRLAWIAAAAALVAVIEAVAIVALMNRSPAAVSTAPSLLIESPRSGDTVMVDGQAVGATPLQLQVNPQMRAIRLVPAEPAAGVQGGGTAAGAAPPGQTAAAAIAQAAARQRSGGIRFSSPIPLSVLEGDRVLGSTADGPIVAAAGTHRLDLVNTELGYRVRQNVTIRAGVVTPMTITPPMGRISINAQPWAQVLIDNTPVGETPLANVPASLGEHEIVFRHPQLGERRERVTVRADAPARVSTTFQRQ